MATAVISPRELLERFRANEPMELVDVRTPAEFREVHVAFASNAPLESLDARAFAETRKGKSVTTYVICHKGSRGQQACERLSAAGLQNVCNVEGGTEACIEAGLPCERGQKTISLERQVRIAAGSLVLAGAILALTVDPYFVGLCAFVGAGLVFAGVTNTCGMAMVLARMPWNQAGAAPKVACVS